MPATDLDQLQLKWTGYTSMSCHSSDDLEPVQSHMTIYTAYSRQDLLLVSVDADSARLDLGHNHVLTQIKIKNPTHTII